MESVGFLNLPLDTKELRQTLIDFGASSLLGAPVLGSEEVEKPWTPCEEETFFSGVEAGLHFPDRPNPRGWTKQVITSDSKIALQRISEGMVGKTGIRGAIGGTFPILDIIGNHSWMPLPRRLITITDGVAGFLFHEMESSGKTFDQALQEAQWKKVAPGNPTLHLHSLIARDRLALLASLLFGKKLPAEGIWSQGFGGINPRDFEIGKTLNLSLRLLGVVELRENGFECWVRPCYIPSRYILAQVRGGCEAVYMQCRDDSSFVFTGPGSGFRVSLRGMLKDLQMLASGGQFGYLTPAPAAFPHSEKVLPIDHCPSQFLLRLSLVNFASTLGQIANAFSEAGVEITRMVHGREIGYVPQTEGENGQSELLLITDSIPERIMNRIHETIRKEIRLATVKACIRYEG